MSTEDTTNTKDMVITLLGASARLTRQLDNALAAIKGISFSEYQMLTSLRDDPATRVDLAAAVGLTPSGVTRALKPLEKLGFVETAKDARDARKSLARLTPAGHELVADADGVVDDAVGDVDALESLGANERELIADVLTQLAAS